MHDDFDERSDDRPLISLFGWGLACLVLLCVAAAGLAPLVLTARKGGNEAATIGSLKAIANAQTLFREGDKDQDGVLAYTGSLQELGAAGPDREALVDPVLAAGTKQGYHFSMGTGRDPRFEFWAKACPVVPGETGHRFFAVDMRGLVYFSSSDFPISDPLDPDNLPAGVHVLGN